MAQQGLLPCVLILILLSLAAAVPARTTPLTPIFQPPLLNASSPTCLTSRYWVPFQVRKTDCIQALDIFRRLESNKSPTQRFEFIVPSAKQLTQLLPLQTPRLYTYKSCTVSLTMLWSFPKNVAPPQRERWWPKSDVASLDELQAAAKEVVEECVGASGGGLGQQTVGWAPMGRLDKGIAVTVWETGSAVDKAFRRGQLLGHHDGANATLVA